MPLFTSLEVYGLTISILFHMEGCQEDGVVFIDSVTVQDSDINIFELLDSDIADKIIDYCCENLDKIISYNDDGGVY